MGREIDTSAWLRFGFGGLEVQADGETSTISGSWKDELPKKRTSLHGGRRTVSEIVGGEDEGRMEGSLGFGGGRRLHGGHRR